MNKLYRSLFWFLNFLIQLICFDIHEFEANYNMVIFNTTFVDIWSGPALFVLQFETKTYIGSAM